ncbi:MAG: hypothetical protein U0T73_11990 [Chitinophagales bacterium]
MSTASMEMKLYGAYITQSVPSESLCQRYEEAIQIKLQEETPKAVIFLLKHPWALPFFDNATGWFIRNHPLRLRLELAFALVETDPEMAAFFMPQSFSFFHLFILAWRGMLSLLQGAIGFVILKFL